jgi:hypothetical protein
MHTQQPKRPLCRLCNTSLAKPNGQSKLGFTRWHRYCVDCSNASYNPRNGHLLFKNKTCNNCGFKPADNGQLELVYLDGNAKNKNETNLNTLCLNCGYIFKKKLREKTKSKLDITTDADVDISSL